MGLVWCSLFSLELTHQKYVLIFAYYPVVVIMIIIIIIISAINETFISQEDPL